MFKKNQAPNQKKHEKNIYTLRRHWLIPVKIILFYGLLALIPIVFYILAQGGLIDNLLGRRIIGPIIILGTSIYYLSIWLFAFHQFIDYYLDTWFVTTQRIISINQKGLFSRTISEHKLYRIQDVTAEIKGIFPTIFNYGNLHIQTAGTKLSSIFKQIPNPNHVSKTINKLVERDKKIHQNTTLKP